MPGNAVAYIRVSTGKQAKSGLGLEAQTEAIRAFAKTEGYKIAGSFEEHESGKGADALDRRPKLTAAIKAAKKAGGPVIVSKLDRLSRDVHFISGLMMHKVPFIVAELGSDVDPFVLHLFAALAQKERSLISSRTREGLKAARARGQALGGWTAGSEASKKQADELAERMKPILTELAHLPSARQIAAELNRRGIKSARAASGLPRLSAGYKTVSASVADLPPAAPYRRPHAGPLRRLSSSVATHRCTPRRTATQRNDPQIKGPRAKPCRPLDRSLRFGSWLVPQAIRLPSCPWCALAQPSVRPPKKSRIISISHGVRSSVGFTLNPNCGKP